MTFGELDARDQKLLILMQTVDYGRLEKLSIRNGHAVVTAASRKIRSRKIGVAAVAHRSSRKDGDFLLTEKHLEFLSVIREISDGFINVIQIQAGLPVSLETEESITSI